MQTLSLSIMKIADNAIRKAAAVFIAMAIFVSVAHASIDNVRFEHYFVEQGLSQQSITAIFQDSNGFIWLGTQEGLNRFDGRNFLQFTPSFEDENSLAFSWVNSITEDRHGNIWVGTRDGLSKYDAALDSFTNFKADGQDSSINDRIVRKVWVDSRGDLWATTRKGLNKYLPNEQRFKPYNLNGEDGKSVDIFAITEDISGGLWLGSNEHGLYRFEPTNESFSRIVSTFPSANELKIGEIRSLYIDDTQKLWIGTINLGTYTLDLTQDKPENAAQSLTMLPGMESVTSSDIIQDTDGVLWFGSPQGLTYLTGDGSINKMVHSAKDRNSLSDSSVSALFHDRSNVLWVGTFKGLNRWNKATTQFDHYRVSGTEGRSLTGNVITGISQLNETTALVSNLQGLDRVDVVSGEIKAIVVPGSTPETASNYTVMSSAALNESEVWLGTSTAGLIKYNMLDDTYVQYRRTANDELDERSLRSNGITAIYIDAQETVWIATYGGGLSRYNRAQDDFTTYLTDPDDIYTLSSNRIMSITETRDGQLWLGTWDGGISVFNPATESAFRIQTDAQSENSLSANLVWTIHEDTHNNIWVGTHGGGINLLTAEKRDRADISFERIGKNRGLPSNVVFGILEDDNKQLWVSSNRGLSKLNPQTLSFTNFTYAEGLQDNEFNSGSYLQMSDGRMLFGGSSGVTGFYPNNVSINEHAPSTVITAFQRLDKVGGIAPQLDEMGRLVLEYTDYLIGFEFVGLHFAAPEKNQFKYRLLGFNEQWLGAREIPRAVYTNLPSGEYTFEVISANGDGVWNYEPASVDILVKPAPWFSVYAYTAYIGIIMLMLYMGYRAYCRKLNADIKYRKALEREVTKRTEELSLANENLLKASITDQLTGLFNRRYLFDVIGEKSQAVFENFTAALQRGKADHEIGPRLFFLMFDLDGFKPINDTYGHDAGDKMIQQVAHLLQEVCRINDIVIRWGGDEFLVVGEVNKIEEVAALAERIRIHIAKHGFDIGLSQKMHLSSSIGFSVYPFSHYSPDSLSWEQVHLIADNALYHSKDGGKDMWTGILQSESPVPFTVMNALSLNLDNAIAQKHVKVISS
ncbi:diguanylate cyclase [Glaciecola sp. XM2]|jgi:diguanylate cyclase (GGDEF)-like protein|uniref:ligand-binding sensor domain-containing diguanylate cyclase n=1 Tax=Glaciecola sp. XM2 TaxID=1914931 RepID=UPI001BDE4FEB|nr:ligand-binding sensor domain-containing diguanylate cyclase [Glaciecola sp. XM2]MBT1451648.1 diguanylate cyclase [Glaciecola sp. XM2]